MDFTFINVNVPGSESARVNTPQLVLHDGAGEVVQKWFGHFKREQVEPRFADLLD